MPIAQSINGSENHLIRLQAGVAHADPIIQGINCRPTPLSRYVFEQEGGCYCLSCYEASQKQSKTPQPIVSAQGHQATFVDPHCSSEEEQVYPSIQVPSLFLPIMQWQYV